MLFKEINNKDVIKYIIILIITIAGSIYSEGFFLFISCICVIISYIYGTKFNFDVSKKYNYISFYVILLLILFLISFDYRFSFILSILLLISFIVGFLVRKLGVFDKKYNIVGVNYIKFVFLVWGSIVSNIGLMIVVGVLFEYYELVNFIQ